MLAIYKSFPGKIKLNGSPNEIRPIAEYKTTERNNLKETKPKGMEPNKKQLIQTDQNCL